VPVPKIPLSKFPDTLLEVSRFRVLQRRSGGGWTEVFHARHVEGNCSPM